MNEAMGYDPEESSFADSIREGIEQLRQQRGPCPAPDVLARFMAGLLPADHAAQVRLHIDACGLCDVALGRLEKRRTTQSVERSNAFLTLLRGPVLAYVVIALLLYPAYRGLFPKRPASASSQLGLMRPKAAPSFTLDAQRGSSAPLVIVLPPRQDLFILTFFVPTRPDMGYSAVIANAAGMMAAADLIPTDRLGNYHLICGRNALPPGDYRLIVKERDRVSLPSGREFIFQFVVQP